MRAFIALGLVLCLTGCLSFFPQQKRDRERTLAVREKNRADAAERAEFERRLGELQKLTVSFDSQTRTFCPHGAEGRSEICPNTGSGTRGTARAMASQLLGMTVSSMDYIPVEERYGGVDMLRNCINETRVDGLVNVLTAYWCVRNASTEIFYREQAEGGD